MSKRAGIAFFAIVLVLVTAHIGVRSAFGRERADLAAWVSYDDGLWTYQRTFRDGAVGPFLVDQSRNAARNQLKTARLFDLDRLQVTKPSGDWRIALPAQSGGCIIYTVRFDADRVASVKAYYSVFAGL